MKTVKFSDKQYEALQELLPSFIFDTEKERICNRGRVEILYGGAAGGGKSVLGSRALVLMADKMPGSKWAMVRKTYSELEDTNVPKLKEAIEDYGIEEHVQYKQKEKKFIFSNGSEISLRHTQDSKGQTRLVGFDLTGVWIDEAQQVPETAYDQLKTRFRVFKGGKGEDAWEINGSICLYTANPGKNWTYSKFYIPHRDGKLEDGRKFIQAKFTDNPFINLEAYYDEHMSTNNQEVIETYLYGNYEYDNSDGRLFSTKDILNMRSQKEIDENEEIYMTGDPSGEGDDLSVIMLWKGLRLIKLILFRVTKPGQFRKKMEELAQVYKVARTNITYDSVGIGYDIGVFHGARPFDSRKKPVVANGRRPKVKNFKTQCMLQLAHEIGKIDLSYCTSEQFQEIQRQFSVVKYDTNDNGEIEINSKKEMKKSLDGKSPDLLDCIMMRMIFILKPKIEVLDAKDLTLIV